MERDRIQEALFSLPLQNKIIILGASKFSSGSTGELYLAYTDLARVPLEMLTQRRVSGIIAES